VSNFECFLFHYVFLEGSAQREGNLCTDLLIKTPPASIVSSIDMHRAVVVPRALFLRSVRACRGVQRVSGNAGVQGRATDERERLPPP
jgi:hypothetical protein